MKKIIKNIIGNKNYKKLQTFNRAIKKNKVVIKAEEIDQLKKIEKSFPNVLSTTETLNLIIKNRISICRFGDAEFDICNHENKEDSYQKPSKELSKRLKEILKSNDIENLLICIPPFNSKTNNKKYFYGKLSFWEWYWLNRFEKIEKLFGKFTYGNSFVTRESVFSENSLSEIKKIWENREVVFIYGKNGRFKENSCIFDNIKSKKTIHVNATNAFNQYNHILEKSLKESKDTLFLVAAGPTATVLCYDLHKSGYQCIDIGHLPNAYDEYKGLIISPENIPLVRDENEK